jgi:tRNA pseudouridine32 synthase/23S rRNA pseudouridine746 synthase
MKERVQEGHITDANGQPVTLDTPYQPGLELFYYREVAHEIQVPFAETVMFQDEHILVACKPHFLPVTPGGKYVNECLLYRLRAKTGNNDLVPLHRLDRETAGLVLFSINKESRGLYGDLFDDRKIDKVYEAIGSLPPDKNRTEWEIANRIEKRDHWLVVADVEGEINARTKIELIERNGAQARYRLFPSTGKTHQLRLHLTLIGAQIANDRLYPVLLPAEEPNFAKPLKLLAKSLYFIDPLSGEPRRFESKRKLDFD